MSELFRREAVAHATRRLAGPVVLATPLSVKVLGTLLAGTVFAAAAFAASASYARKATVAGWLVPDQGLVRAVSPAAGLVQRLLVKEGDIVQRGARIAELGLAAETADGNVGEMIARSLVAQAQALAAKSQAQLARLEAEAEQGEKRLSDLMRELEQAKIQVTLQEERLQLARKLVTQSEAIAAKGYIARKEFDSRRSAALAAEQQLAAQRSQVATLERDMSDLKARLAAMPLELAAARAEHQTAEATLQQRAAEAEARRVQFVTAPVAGRIAALPATIGQTVGAGSSIAVMTPLGAKLEAELLAPSRSVGFIRDGQEVGLMLQAFPYQRFGMLRGQVRSVSSTILGPGEISIPGISLQEPVFRVRVALPRETIYAYGEPLPLQPGMLLSADIVFDRRSLVEWLFDPVYAVGART